MMTLYPFDPYTPRQLPSVVVSNATNVAVPVVLPPEEEGVTEFEAADDAPLPKALLAFTVHV